MIMPIPDSAPGEKPYNLWDQLTPSGWRQIEFDVLSRLKALRCVADDLEKSDNSPEEIAATKHAIAQLLILLAHFVSRINVAEDYITLDFNANDKASKKLVQGKCKPH